MGFQASSQGEQEKSEISAIFNQYKNTLDDFIDSLDDTSDTEPPAILRQIIMPNGDIPDLRDNASDLKEDGDFLDDGPHG